MSEATLSVHGAVPARISEDWLAVRDRARLVRARSPGLCRGRRARLGRDDVRLDSIPAPRSPRPRRPMRRSAAQARFCSPISHCSSSCPAGAFALGEDVKRFALAFTAVFAIAYASWFIGSWARFAAVTPADQAKFGLSWSLKLTSEGGFIVALLAGLAIANFFPLSPNGSKARSALSSTSRSPSSSSAPSSR